MNIDKSVKIAKASRKSIVSMTCKARASHTASSLSVIDMLSVIYTMASASQQENPLDNDLVVVSKGHASAATYSALAHSGYFPTQWLDDFCTDGSPLGGHVNHHGVPGVELSTGSLGHGLSFAAGRALGNKLSGSQQRVFVVLSDGECNEGSVWEAALFANHHHLNNLVVLIDRNRLQSLKSTEETLALDPLDLKWSSFGWDTYTVNGHSHSELWNVLEPSQNIHSSKPKLVVCETVKGFGVSFMENSVAWHYKSPSTSEVEQAHLEIERRF
jgi:transketolase